MLQDMFDIAIGIIFCCLAYTAYEEVSSFFIEDAVKTIHKGPSETTPFTRSLTGKRFDWEVED